MNPVAGPKIGFSGTNTFRKGEAKQYEKDCDGSHGVKLAAPAYGRN